MRDLADRYNRLAGGVTSRAAAVPPVADEHPAPMAFVGRRAR